MSYKRESETTKILSDETNFSKTLHRCMSYFTDLSENFVKTGRRLKNCQIALKLVFNPRPIDY